MVHYMITITNSKRNESVTQEHLNEVLNGLPNEWTIKETCSEKHGRYGQLHLHGIVDIPSGMQYKKYTIFKKSTRIMVVHYQRIRNYQATLRYIYKSLGEAYISVICGSYAPTRAMKEARSDECRDNGSVPLGTETSGIDSVI